MKKIMTFLLISCFVTPVYANNTVDIDKLKREVQKKHLKISSFYDVIKALEQRSALSILNDYHSPKARLIQLWLLIVFQKYDSLEQYDSKSFSHFINNSQRVITSYLGQLQFDPEQELSEKDYRDIKQEINKIIKNSESYSDGFVNDTYIAIENIHLRKLPIVLKITKKQDGKGEAIIVGKKELVTLLYHIEYENKNNQIVRWAFVETEAYGHGWVNLRLIAKIEGL